MILPTDKLREAVREYLKNVASEDAPNEWYGYDTNVGNLLSDECLAPFQAFFTSALQKEHARLMELLPRKYKHENNPTHSKEELWCCLECYDDGQKNIALREVRELLALKDDKTVV